MAKAKQKVYILGQWYRNLRDRYQEFVIALVHDSDSWYLFGGLSTVLAPQFGIVHYQYHYILVPIAALWIHHRSKKS